MKIDLKIGTVSKSMPKKMKIQKSKINGKGLFVTKNYTKGSIIDYVHGPKILVRVWTPRLSKISPDWIGASRYTWIDTTHSLFRYINHSCNPNVAIKGQRTVYALYDINAGDEIVMDYSFTESDRGWSIPKCNCGSKNCRKIIGPITTLDKDTYHKFETCIPEKFKKIYLLDHELNGGKSDFKP